MKIIVVLVEDIFLIIKIMYYKDKTEIVNFNDYKLKSKIDYMKWDEKFIWIVNFFEKRLIWSKEILFLITYIYLPWK